MADNIRFGRPDASRAEVEAAARAVRAEPTIMDLPHGYDTEARVQQALRRLRQGRTTIIIAHRLSTIAQADQIAVVSDGRIVKSGHPEDLRARGGRFAVLFDRWVAGAA